MSVSLRISLALIATLVNLTLLAPGLLVGRASCEEQTDGAPMSPSVTFHAGELCGNLECTEITESSGVAASQTRANVFWTHNDSGDSPRIFAFQESGEHVGTWTVPVKRAIDWEDMAAFTLDDQPLLLLADTGDNLKRRRQYQLHVLEDSIPTAQEEMPLVRTIAFKYQSGSRDCEAVAVDATTREIILITKSWEPRCEVHSIDWQTTVDGLTKTHIASKIADLAIAGITGLDISPSGEFAVATTYGNAYLFERQPEESWSTAFQREAMPIVNPPRKQGESVCFAHDGLSLVLTSEKLPTPVFRLNIRKEQD